MRNTADVTGGKPIAVLLHSISGVRPINPLVAFYDIHGGKREVLFFSLRSNRNIDKKQCIQNQNSFGYANQYEMDPTNPTELRILEWGLRSRSNRDLWHLPGSEGLNSKLKFCFCL
jgi:hypothetical protein